MPQFKKKPVVITAEQWFPGKDLDGVFIKRFYTDPADLGGRMLVQRPAVTTNSGQDVFIAPGDWIVPEPDGMGYYPCKPEVFAQIYEVLVEENPILETKRLRVDLDAIIQRVKGLTANRPTSIVCTKLDEAVMWLGQNLKELGNPNPYPNSRNLNNLTVDPTADGLKFSA